LKLPSSHLETVRELLGAEFPAWENAFATPAPTSIRINPLKWKAELPAERIPWSHYGYYLPERPSFTHDPLFHAGCYYVQEASSMSLEQVFRQQVNSSVALRVLDLCGAPGGKSTHAMTMLNEGSLLVSNEVIRSRAHVLAENISKWGRDQSVVTSSDPEEFAGLPGFFDVIIADLPCSGEGLFRRAPEAAEEWSPANVELCSARQRRIVLDVWPALKPDGLLIYSTCTFNRHENEENLLWLRDQSGFESVRIEFADEWGVMETQTDDIYAYRFFPHRVKGEGFFFSVLRKTEGAGSVGKFRPTLAPASAKEKAEVASFLKEPHRFDIFNHDGEMLAFRKTISEDMQRVSQQLKVVQAGLSLAEAGKGFKPSHQLALSVELNRGNFQETKLDRENALRFLAKEDVKITGGKGISLVTYEDAPLGWLNLLGNRANNLYPKEWRIRKL
jgi:16S rRNA C967 or C1407 C5-methylase (RsmB/RsmF family)/NOL1/NOP2/fmu family ribosome biogenesis protein